MVSAGAEEEIRRANAAGASVTARKALGFNELLAGDVEAMKRRTRNYARRQLTWMRKLADVNVIDVTDRSPTEVAALGLAAQHPRRAPGPPLRRPHAPPPAPRRSQPGPAPPAAHPPTPPPS